MFQPKALPPFKSPSLSIAGKVFVLGEYAVLAGLPALVASVGPRFQMKVGHSDWNPHPASPAGLLEKWARQRELPKLQLDFVDPFQGAGGFGASTAQFGMAYLAYAQISDSLGKEAMSRHWGHPWKLYRELTRDLPLPPSGADLVAQWQGGMVFFDPSDQHCRDFWPLFGWSQLLVFSATQIRNRKVATHDHLSTWSGEGFADFKAKWRSQLERPLLQGLSAVHQNESEALGAAMNDYADVLQRAGLEVDATAQDREVLLRLPDVLGVKGAGAMQSDALLVLIRPGSPHRNRVIEEALGRGLILVSDGLPSEMGVMCQIGS